VYGLRLQEAPPLIQPFVQPLCVLREQTLFVLLSPAPDGDGIGAWIAFLHSLSQRAKHELLTAPTATNYAHVECFDRDVAAMWLRCAR
jgi:hypothetical protein